MAMTWEQKCQLLFEESDGVEFDARVKRLKRAGSRAQLIDLLSSYVVQGQLLHWRGFLCADLAEMAEPTDAALGDRFATWLTSDHGADVQYWAVLGLVRVRGRAAEPTLVALASNPDAPKNVRAHALKQLACSAVQPFDRGLSSDPGFWEPDEIESRAAEAVAWFNSGAPSGTGSSDPQQHPALARPRSQIELLASELAKKLARRRLADDRYDPANPTGWLVPAEAGDLAAIDAVWSLPSDYREFLEKFSPLKVYLPGRRFGWHGELNLYGAAELLEAQRGYSTTGTERLPGWPQGLVVIADVTADPWVIEVNTGEIFTAGHGKGEWDFSKECGTFAEFLAALAK